MTFLITTGPTREPIDPVRFLSNRSSGRMGFALAEQAQQRGHQVTLISGPVSLATPKNVTRIDIVTAADMHQAVTEHIGQADVAIFSAAVADYTPVDVLSQKLKKSEDILTLKLKRTQDILGSVRTEMGFKGYLVGFAAETENVLANALQKYQRKGCDLLVANDVSRPDIGFDQRHNEVTLLFRDGQQRPIAKATKDSIAASILDHIANDLSQTHP